MRLVQTWKRFAAHGKHKRKTAAACDLPASPAPQHTVTRIETSDMRILFRQLYFDKLLWPFVRRTRLALEETGLLPCCKIRPQNPLEELPTPPL